MARHVLMIVNSKHMPRRTRTPRLPRAARESYHAPRNCGAALAGGRAIRDHSAPTMSAHDSKHSKGHAAPADASNGALPFAPTLRKLIVILLVGFAVPVIILVLIAHFIADETAPPASSEAVGTQVSAASTASTDSAASTEQRIAPVAQASAAAPVAASAVATGAAPAAGGTTVADAGKKVYESTCIACHGAGVAGAPKFGDKADWAPIIAQGMPTLYDRALHGYTGKRGMMPPKGGSTASDADVKAAVDYMVAAAK